MARVSEGGAPRSRRVGHGARDPGLGNNVGGAGNRPRPRPNVPTPPTQADRTNVQRPGPHSLTPAQRAQGQRLPLIPPKPPQWIVDRQKMLRNAGYGVVVDGRWGQRAQTAWAQFLRDLNQRPTAGGRRVDPGGPRVPQPGDKPRVHRLNTHGLTGVLKPAVPWAGKGPSALHPAAGVGPTRPLTPGQRRKMAEKEATRRRREDLQELARRNPTIARALFPGPHGTRPALGLGSVPWARKDVVKALMPEDILRLIQNDKEGIFLRKVKLGGKEYTLPTRTTQEMLKAWVRSRGYKTKIGPAGEAADLRMAIDEITKRADRREKKRHADAVQRALFDTGFAARALATVGLPHLNATKFAAALRGDPGTPWNPKVLDAVIGQIATLQKRELVDAEFAKWRDLVLANGGLLNASVMGPNGLGMTLPWDGNRPGLGGFAPPSVVGSKNEKEYRFWAFQEQAKQAGLAMQWMYANKLQTESGKPYTVNYYPPTPSDPQFSTAVVEVPLPRNEEGYGRGWGGYFNFLNAIVPAKKGGAIALEAANAPAVWVTEHVFATYAYATGNLGALNSQVQYVSARNEHDIASGAVIRSLPGRPLSWSEAIEQGHVWHDGLPTWAQILAETAFDPLNFVNGKWVTAPINGIRRLRGGVKVVEDAVADAGQIAEHLAGAPPAVPPTKQRGLIRSLLTARRDHYAEIAAEMARHMRLGWVEAKLRPSLRAAIRANRNQLKDLVLTSRALVAIQGHARKAGASLYIDAQRSQPTIFGTHVEARFNEAYRGLTMKILQARHPELDLHRWDVGNVVEGAPRAPLIREQQELEQHFRAFVENELMPFLQDIIEEETPLVYDDAGKWLPQEGAKIFEQNLLKLAGERMEELTHSINPNFGRLASWEEYQLAREIEIQNVLHRTRTQVQARNPERWISEEPGDIAWRHSVLETAKLNAENRLNRSWISWGDARADDVVDEVHRLIDLSEQEVTGYEQAVVAHERDLAEVEAVAGELAATARASGQDFRVTLGDKDADALADEWLEANGGELPLDPAKRHAELAQAWQEAASGLGPVDWEKLTLRGKLKERSVRKRIKLGKDGFTVLNGSVLTRPNVSRQVKEALDALLDADFDYFNINRSEFERRRAGSTLDRQVYRILGGETTKEALRKALTHVLTDTDELLQLRTTMNDLTERVIKARKLHDQVYEDSFVRGVRNHNELRELSADVDELLRQQQRAREQFYTALWRLAPPEKIEKAIADIEAERLAIAEARGVADDEPDWIKGFERGVEPDEATVEAAAEAAFEEQAQRMSEHLSAAAHREFDYYVSADGYLDINTLLRLGPDATDQQLRDATKAITGGTWDAAPSLRVEWTRERIEKMDAYFASAEGLDEPRTVYRGVYNFVARELHGRFADPGFTSVSTERSVADIFAGGDRGKVFRVELPAGLPVYFGHLGEHELVLPRGLEFERVDEDTLRVVGGYRPRAKTVRPESLLEHPAMQPPPSVEEVREMLARSPEADARDFDLLDRVLQRRKHRLELLVDPAATRRAKADEMLSKGAGWSLEREYRQMGRAKREIDTGLERAKEVRDHYQGLDVAELLAFANRDLNGFLDLRPHLHIPKMYTKHQGGAGSLRDIADEADAFAWMQQDSDFLDLPEFNPLPDDPDAAVRQITKEAGKRPRAEMEALVDERVPFPEQPPDGAAGVADARGAQRARPAGDGAFALGVGRELPPQTSGVDLDHVTVGREKMRSDDFLRHREGPDAKKQRSQMAQLFRERRRLNQEAADEFRADELRKRHLWVASLKYADSTVVRATVGFFRWQLQVWKTAILPGTPGWVLLNYLDNTVKMMVQGILDPRLWINPSGKSFPEWAPLSLIRRIVKLLDARFQTNALPHFDALVDNFWSQNSKVLDLLIGSHGIDFPAELMDGSFTRSIRVAGDDEGIGRDLSFKEAFAKHDALEREAKSFEAEGDRLRAEGDPFTARDFYVRAKKVRDKQKGLTIGAFRDAVWHLTAEAGEGWARRATYSHYYRKFLREAEEEAALRRRAADNFPDRGLVVPDVAELQQQAIIKALKQVNHMLFDPGDVTALEDNLSIIFPFINFVKSNTKFWANKVVEDPWVLSGLDRWDDHAEATGDPNKPSWMHRYRSIGFLNDVPILNHLNDALFKDGYFDPRNLASINTLWRSFKDANDLLTPERGGIEFLNQLVNSTEDVGLGWNPFFKKAAEMAGIISPQFWRDVFPQTTLVQAMTAEHLGGQFPNGFNIEAFITDPLYKKFTEKSLTEWRRADFDEMVNRETGGQIKRGEPVDRAKAEKKISDWLVAHTVWSWATHVYIRRVTPEDAWFSRMAERMRDNPDEQLYFKFTEQEKNAYQVFKHRRMGAQMLDRWMELQPKVIHYQQLTGAERDYYLANHPEIAPHVGLSHRQTLLYGRRTTYGEVTIQRREQRKHRALMAAQTEVFFDIKEALYGDDETLQQHRQALEDRLVTPALRNFWALNDTPADIQRAQMRLEFEHLVADLNRAYHNIPKADFHARQVFLDNNPILREHWLRSGVRLSNGMPTPGAQAKDLLDLNKLMRAHLRDYYFALLDVSGFDVAAAFLRRNSDMFVGTKSADNVSEISTDAFWVPGGIDSEQGQMYIRIKPWLDAYFAALEAGNDELKREIGRQHPEIYEYFDRFAKKGKKNYGKGDKRTSQHAEDYRKVKSLLDHYFKLPRSERGAFVDANPELRDYFKKYGKEHTRGRRARRWVHHHGQWKGYANSPQERRQQYLKDHPGLEEFLDEHDARSKFGAGKMSIARRAEFWMKLYALPPDERADFIRAQAANYGVFVYGILGQEVEHDNGQHDLAYQFAHGDLSRQQAYLYAKPLLDVFFALTEDEQQLFLDANPEMQIYFRYYTKQKSLSGDPATDKLIEQFFELPDDPRAKEEFLKLHPEVQVYFHSRQTPEERALGRLVDAYFQIDFNDRDRYLQQHPEVLAYFDVRKHQKDAEKELREAFDQTDPRFAEFLQSTWDLEFYAESMHNKLQQARGNPIELAERVERNDTRPKKRRTALS